MTDGFQSLKKDELLKVAAEFGTEVKDNFTKAEIETALNEDGVYWDDYQRLVKAVEDENERLAKETLQEQPTPEKEEGQASGERVLLRMTRKNPTYDVRGARFTKDRPFAFLSEEDADWVVENLEGFRPATSKEVREFYGKK